MVADEVDYVIGVDTHRDEHTLAAVTAPTATATRANLRARRRVTLHTV
jgi:hypothetical protein